MMLQNKTSTFIYLLMLVVVLAVQLWPGLTYAAEPARQEAPKTGFELICTKTIGLAGCIAKIYLFSLGAGALIALLMVVLAGYRYMTAGGNAEQVSAAKESLEMAFKGLIIIFVGFILLYLINPDLVQFKPLQLPNLMP